MFMFIFLYVYLGFEPSAWKIAIHKLELASFVFVTYYRVNFFEQIHHAKHLGAGVCQNDSWLCSEKNYWFWSMQKFLIVSKILFEIETQRMSLSYRN